jgi:hypothetical protein
MWDIYSIEDATIKARLIQRKLLSQQRTSLPSTKKMEIYV